MTILIADLRIASITVVERGDPLVDLGDLAPTASPTGRLVRRGVALRLRAADRALPDGMRLRVVEALRSSADQQRIIDTYAALLRIQQPGIGDVELERLTSRHVAPLSTAPHIAGAAVDLTLVDRKGDELWMGSALDATPEESNGACYTNSPAIDSDARLLRSIMSEALEAVELVNYPTEWWHWSFGDRYWAYATDTRHAIYGPAHLAVAS